jgi:hypothetical protein
MKTLLVKSLAWFAAYVGVVLGFSFLYWGLYLSGPHHFRVSHSPFNQAFLEIRDQLRVGQRLVREIRSEAQANGIAEGDLFDSVTAEELPALRPELAPAQGDPEGLVALPPGYKLSDHAMHRLSGMVGRYRLLLSDLDRTYTRLAMRHADAYAEVGFEDFVYFSASTISTLGYGDIVPNTTQSRRLVFGEILLGLFLTLFFIHFLMGFRRGAETVASSSTASEGTGGAE